MPIPRCILVHKGFEMSNRINLLLMLILSQIFLQSSIAQETPQIKAAIKRGVSFIKSKISDEKRGGFRALYAYALLKAGEPVNGAAISQSIETVQAKVKNGVYTPTNTWIYEAGCDAMLLADANGNAYQEELMAIRDFILSKQHTGGYWDYKPDHNHYFRGDTSITQYGILGLWAIERAGVPVPQSAWNSTARWHVGVQFADGGYNYHPGATSGYERGGTSINLTNASLGSMMVARLYLFPGAGDIGSGNAGQKSTPSKQNDDSKVPAVLKKIDLDKSKKEKKKPNAPAEPVQNRIGITALDNSIKAGMNWAARHYVVVNSAVPKMYYYYTVERFAALAGISKIGNHDWYQECSAALLKMQNKDGSWKSPYGLSTGTSFAILFLKRPTAKLLGRPIEPADPIGGGLLAGGRGLPENLSTVRMVDGKVQSREISSPLDELLNELQKPQGLNMQAAQKALIEKVQFGDRKALLGQFDLLTKLSRHKDAESRRTAIWALGRSDQLKAVPLILERLKKEPKNVDMMVEANNALCWIARRADGPPPYPQHSRKMALNPLAGLPEDVSDDKKNGAVEKWHREILLRWSRWYEQVRPYKERDGLADLENLP